MIAARWVGHSDRTGPDRRRSDVAEVLSRVISSSCSSLTRSPAASGTDGSLTDVGALPIDRFALDGHPSAG